MEGWISSLCECMVRYIGQTVTVFTTSGGLSGCGFTGVLISVDCNCIRLLCDVGAPPACPVGSACGGCSNLGSCGFGCGTGCGCGCQGNPFGAICVIPMCAVAAFTHNAL